MKRGRQKFICFFVLITIIFLYSGITNASLLGDTIFIEHRFPHIDSEITLRDPGFGAYRTIEQAEIDEGKRWVYNPTWPVYYVDFEDDRILVTYRKSWSWAATGHNLITFNGLFIKDINDPVEKLSIDTNIFDWNDERIYKGEGFIGFDWKGISFSSDSYFYINLKFSSQQNAIPEPATLFLLMGGLGFINIITKKDSNNITFI